MYAVLFLSLIFILGAAVPFPWWQNSAYGWSQHHRLRDKQPPAYETKVFDHEALQKAAARLKALDVYTGSIAKSGGQAIRWQLGNAPDAGRYGADKGVSGPLGCSLGLTV